MLREWKQDKFILKTLIKENLNKPQILEKINSKRQMKKGKAKSIK